MSSKPYKPLKDIAKEVRTKIKQKYSNCKVSVSIDTGASYTGSIRIALMSAPFEVFEKGTDARTIENGYYTVNQYYIDRENITKEAKKFFKDALSILKEYHWDESDPYAGYSRTNFYMDFSIGKWNQPFVPKTDKKAIPSVSEPIGTYKSKRKLRTLEGNIIEGILKTL